jgi:succinyl-diaminopimelate desuccinylase
MTEQKIDPVTLTQALVRCPSVTPAEAGALDLLEETLSGLGFRCTRLPFSEEGTPNVDNLYARIGDSAPHLCFAGHTDVVPVGDAAAWAGEPFSAEVRDGQVYGRGTADMKGAIAAFVAAAARAIAGGNLGGSLSLLITGDEEGPAINGTRKMLEWLVKEGETPDHCIVGEPTNPTTMGEMIKIGRRGSMNGTITVTGRQGHVAYPNLNENPVPGLVRILAGLKTGPLDEGNERFSPSNFEVTAIDVGEPAYNVVPGRARALFNVRFSTLHKSGDLKEMIRAQCDKAGVDHELAFHLKGEPFLCEPGKLVEALSAAIEERLGRRPELGTTGGTSDARYIAPLCPVAEFGLVGATMHAVDEQVGVGDIEALADIYERVIVDLLGG